MPYQAQISRTSPTAFLFVVDQSGSMADKMSSGRSKAEFVADALNRTLANLIIRSRKSEGVRDYFDVGVIGYGGTTVGNGFAGPLGSKILNPISEIERHPLRVEDRKRRMDDGAGGIIETGIKFPVWFEPRADGVTPMHAALSKAAEEVVAWCDAHPDCYPPTVLHVTDGESTDGDPEGVASELGKVHTNDGEVLVLNIHVSVLGTEPIRFPTSDRELPDSYAKMLFRMSSQLPKHLVDFAKQKVPGVAAESRGFMFNAEAAEIVDFFDIGTRASQLDR